MKVRDFMSLTDQDEIARIKAIKTGIKGRDHIGRYGTKPFIKYRFGRLVKVREYYSSGRIDHLCSATIGIGYKELSDIPYESLLYFLKFVEEQLEIIEMLERRLSDDTDPEESMKLEAAGISEMSKFEELNIVDELAGGDPSKWQYIYNMTYEEVFTKLLRNKTKADIQKRLAKIKK